MRVIRALMAVMLATAGVGGRAQDVATAPHQSGTVKATTATGMTVTTAAGADVTVAVPVAAKVLVVAPGSKDLKSATAGSLADVATGDRVLVTGTAGDTVAALTATRVVLMKSSAIAQSHAAEDAAWAQGGGGIVKSVDAAAGTLVFASGLKTITVTTTPATVVRRYSGDSVRFADAQVSTLAVVKPGDQVRVRGAKSADGLMVTADELVTGSFHNYSGLIASIDPTTQTVTLKDLASKKTVTVAVTANSDVRRIPAMAAARIAMQMKGGVAAPGGGGGAPGGGLAAPGGGGAGGGGGTGGAGPDGAQRAGRAGTDLSSMLARLPTETLGGLKVGDAVMIVATSATADSAKSSAITLLVGVDAILTAAPAGTGMTLSPWSIGGAPSEGGAQ